MPVTYAQRGVVRARDDVRMAVGVDVTQDQVVEAFVLVDLRRADASPPAPRRQHPPAGALRPTCLFPRVLAEFPERLDPEGPRAKR